MTYLDILWIGLVLGVWGAAQAAVLLSLWRLRNDREVEEPKQSWEDGFDNWYPDYPFNESRVKREKAVGVESGPDKHEEEE